MKVPEPRKLPSGNYNIHLRLGGESISVTSTSEKDCKKQAQLIKAEYLAGRRQRVNRALEEKTLQEIQESYIKSSRAALSPSTVKAYQQYATGRWTGYREKQLKDITWQDMINDELGKVSPKTVKNAWGLVTASMRSAGYPVPDVKLAQCPVHEIDFLQPDEIKPFTEWIRGRNYETAALLLLQGLRMSEALGLDWKNVDTSRGVLHVRGAMVSGPEGRVSKETNKNRSSSRDVPIMIPRLLELLKAAEAHEGPVVTLHPSPLLRDVKRASLRSVGREITAHGLRHSFASLCYRIPEVSERQLMAWGGWSDIQTMHKIYIRLAQADESRARDAVTAFFSGENANENANKRKKAP